MKPCNASWDPLQFKFKVFPTFSIFTNYKLFSSPHRDTSSQDTIVFIIDGAQFRGTNSPLDIATLDHPGLRSKLRARLE